MAELHSRGAADRGVRFIESPESALPATTNTIAGTAGADTLTGTTANDRINCLDGNDLARGGGGSDVIIGAGGLDTLIGGKGDDYLSGDAADDSLRGGSGTDSLVGGDGNNVLRGDGGNDDFLAGPGDDTLDGGKGKDTIYFDSGPINVSLLWQGFVQDTSNGQDLLLGFEHLIGSPEADVLTGDNRDNWIWGGPIFGGSGSGMDTINGLGGNDLVSVAGLGAVADGGDGRDTVILDDIAFGADFYNRPQAIDLSRTDPQVCVIAGGQFIWLQVTNFENAGGGAKDDVLTGNDEANILTGASGGDTLIGGLGDDRLYGDGFTYFSKGNIFRLQDGGLGADSLSGGDGRDILIGGWYADTLVGGTGNDILNGDMTDYVVEDSIYTSGADSLDGGDGKDHLYGHAKNDTLRGGADDDLLVGGSGADVMTGGSGLDVFRYLDTRDSSPDLPDLITDYAAGDIIDLSKIDADPSKAKNQKFVLVQTNVDFVAEAMVEYNSIDGFTLVSLWTDGDAEADMVFGVSGDVSAVLQFIL